MLVGIGESNGSFKFILFSYTNLTYSPAIFREKKSSTLKVHPVHKAQGKGEGKK